MNRRWSDRVSLGQSIILRCNGMGHINGTCRNISFGGAYVTVAPGINLHGDHPLEVMLLGKDRQYQIPARVVRTDTDGTALVFTEYSSRTRDLLRQLLY
jgi:hypothetical protein